MATMGSPPGHADVLGRQELPHRPEQVHQPTSPTRSHRHHHTYQPQQYDEKDAQAYYQQYSHIGGHPQSSFSSTLHSSRLGESIDLEKQAAKRQDIDERSSAHSSHHGSKRSSNNNVIGAYYRVDGEPRTAHSPRHHKIRHICDDGGEEERVEPRGLAEKAAKLLLLFILLLPILSLALSFWTIMITPALLILHPIRLIFTRRRTLSDSILSVLGPTLNLHLRCIHAFPTAPAELQLPTTLAVLLLAAPFSFCLSLWSMLLSFYWLFAAVIGNPDGLDGRSDGRELILTTRLKWENWLRLSVRPEIRS